MSAVRETHDRKIHSQYRLFIIVIRSWNVLRESGKTLRNDSRDDDVIIDDIAHIVK